MTLTPALFIGHGHPLNALVENSYTQALQAAAAQLPVPAAILVISAHWLGDAVSVSSGLQPRTLYDFGRFDARLRELVYPAAGAPEWAAAVQAALAPVPVQAAPQRGFDHGVWTVLKWLFPGAQVPVLQLSLDMRRPPAAHYALGQALRGLRAEGLMIIGSGNVVHNLQQLDWAHCEAPTPAWAQRFAALVQAHLLARNHAALIDYRSLPDAWPAVPSPDHYLPLLYIAALQGDTEPLQWLCEDFQYGSISMLSFRVG